MADVGATVTGAVFVALAIAPTDEVRMLASAMNARWVLTLVGVSLLVSYAIVFEAGFTNEPADGAALAIGVASFAPG